MTRGHDDPPAPATLCVWGGEQDRGWWGGATQVPVVHSVSFGYDDLEQWREVALGRAPGHIYSRNTNPTVAVFEEKVRLLEGAAAATSAATGMAAISATLYALLERGDRVVSVKDTYGGTNRLFQHDLPRLGIDVALCDTTDEDAVRRELAAGCRLLYLESPTNPTVKVVDLAAMAQAGHDAGAVVVVDNTFATPINQNPIALGADLVIHSATKFLGGHADALGGVVCGDRALVERVFHFREIHGAALDPMAAYLLLRGMKTLALRVERQNASALEIARFLEDHPRVERVFYPGLESHPGHAIARRQMRGFGGVLAFEPAGGARAPGADALGADAPRNLDAVRRVLKGLRFAHAAANLGAVETVAGPPSTTSHVECSPEERAAMGIPENLIRYSVGIEDVRDLIADLDSALSAL